MNRTIVGLLGSLLLVGGLLIYAGSRERNSSPAATSTTDSNPSLMLYCAAANRAVIESIRADYEKEFDVDIQIQYGASQTLLSALEVSKTGDLFLPADDSYITLGQEKGLIAETFPLATMHAVLGVKRGNPLKIVGYADLLREGVRVVQANPDAAAIGKITRDTLKQTDQWDALKDHTTNFTTTIADAANEVVIGAADVTIAYDAFLRSYDLDSVSIPELEQATSLVKLAVLKSTKQSQRALHFARYVAARDKGLQHFESHGFKVVRGDLWTDKPELTIYAGSMLRPAIEETIAAFETREGVRVTRVYNGCGILVAQMKAGQHPDAYFACDMEFMNQVPDLFPSPEAISENRLVILVPKGNPQKISTLKDLARPGLKVGIGHEKQCAMGWLTQNTLREGNVQSQVMANVTVQTPTGDMLVNQMQAGSLDAAVAYLSNAAGASEFLDAIAIEGIPCSIAVQPYAIGDDSPNAQTAARLLEMIKSEESKSIFLAEGFQWRVKGVPSAGNDPTTSPASESTTAVSPDAGP